VLDALKHRATACQHNVLKQALADVLVALHDRVVGVFVDAVLAQILLLGRHKEEFRALQALLLNYDPLTTW